MLIIGLTGGLASGKSSVAKIMEGLGAVIIDADAIGREIVGPGSPALGEIVDFFGKGVLFDDGSLDRKKLAGIVFGKPDKIERLNSILHPKIIDEEWRRVREIKQKDDEAVVVINAALLIESGNYKDVDEVVVVKAKEEIMVERAVRRDDLSVGQATERLKAQLPVAKKICYADYILENNGSLPELEVKVKDLYRLLTGKNKKKL